MTPSNRDRAHAFKLHAEISSDTDPLRCYDGTEVDQVFRFFRDSKNADALAAGTVWITTLNKCRADETDSGDSEEAYQLYESGLMHFDVADRSDPRVARLSRMGGITIHPGVENVTINGARGRSRMNDAYVVCTTRRYDPAAMAQTFGEHCVEIRRPKQFFAAVTRQLALERPIGAAAIGCVHYASRTVVGMEPVQGVRGFVKPPVPFEPEQEVRMLWARGSLDPIAPFPLKVPLVSEICTRIA